MHSLWAQSIDQTHYKVTIVTLAWQALQHLLHQARKIPWLWRRSPAPLHQAPLRVRAIRGKKTAGAPVAGVGCVWGRGPPHKARARPAVVAGLCILNEEYRSHACMRQLVPRKKHRIRDSISEAMEMQGLSLTWG
jgi:hypothetical protein